MESLDNGQGAFSIKHMTSSSHKLSGKANGEGHGGSMFEPFNAA
ncbi:hypothetical protein ACWJJH_07335 [Endozoicomonadaceae bacterium StTr2]